MKPGQIDMRNDIESPDPWQNLAHAIVLQAVADYRMAEKQRDLEELERFFRSDWFSMLTKLDPEYLIAKLRSEKSNSDSAEVLEKRIATTSDVGHWSRNDTSAH